MSRERALLLAGFLVAAAVPLVAGRYGLFLATTILVLGLYGAAFDLLYGYTGLLSFGHSVFFGVGAYAAALVVVDAGLGPIVGLVAAFLVAAAVAVGLGLVAVRVTSHGFVIVTILIALIAHLVATSWTSVTGGTDGRTVLVPAIAGAVPLSDPFVRYYVVLAILAGSLLLMRRLVASPVGLAVRMIRDDERRARLLGYDATRYKLGAFAASGAFAGLAGALSTYVTGFVSAEDFSIIVAGDPIIFTLVGGRGTLVGAVLGAALVRLAADRVSELTGAYPLFVGALLVLAAVLEPEGLVGLGKRATRRLRGDDDDE